MGAEKLKEQIANTVTDPRRTSHGNIRHKLVDIIIIGLCSRVCGGTDYVDMEIFGREREAYLRTFLELSNGIPDADTFRRVFERLDPQELSKCLSDWVECERGAKLCKPPSGACRLAGRSVVSIDGKTIRGSANAQHKAYHEGMRVCRRQPSDAQAEVAVPEKTNEITAIPELLDLIDVEGA